MPLRPLQARIARGFNFIRKNILESLGMENVVIFDGRLEYFTII
jgi:hypothetical protein